MRRSPAYIETPQIRLPPAVNISHQNIRGVHSEHTQNFIYPSLKCKWPIHTKLLAPNDLISLSYRTQYCVWNDNVYYELKKKFDWNILVLPDQCSRTFWAFSRYRYRDTIIPLCVHLSHVSFPQQHYTDATFGEFTGHLHKESVRDHFVHAPSQWETTLHCNIVSHWLSACTKLLSLSVIGGALSCHDAIVGSGLSTYSITWSLSWTHQLLSAFYDHTTKRNFLFHGKSKKRRGIDNGVNLAARSPRLYYLVSPPTPNTSISHQANIPLAQPW